MIPLHDDNPTDTRPFVTLALIATCALVFVWQLTLDPPSAERAVFALGAIPAVLVGDAQLAPELVLVPAWGTAVTSMFLHGGWGHLLGNMLYLWIFGNNVEDAMGHARFAVFYLLCGLLALASHALSQPSSEVPLIGASGAISGVLGAYLLLYPRARVLVAAPVPFVLYTLRLPAVYVLGSWFALQLLSSLGAPAGQGGVAWLAHIGGFVAGLVLVAPFKRAGVALLARPRERRR